MSAGLYVHLPFCTYKCPYCDFNTWPLDRLGKAADPARFHARLLDEIGWLLEAWVAEGGGGFETLYFGGGTPSLASPEQIGAIVERVRRAGADPVEITLEANPESFSAERFAGYLQAGVNRISIGAQSFSDEVLRRLGRAHDAARTREVLAWLASEASLRSWSADLIYGVADHSLAGFARELDELFDYRPPHLSLYALEIHQGTDFGRRFRQGERPAAEDDLQAELFELARRRLLAAGYRHYEIANFALPGHGAIHNSLYWRRASVPAAGPGAVGFYRGEGAPHGLRWQVPRAPGAYEARVAALRGGQSLVGALSAQAAQLPLLERPDAGQALAESLFLGLRLLDEGVDLTALETAFGTQAVQRKLASLKRFIEAGWLAERAGRLYLMGERALVANAVFAELIGEGASIPA